MRAVTLSLGAIGGCIIGHHVAAVNAEKLKEAAVASDAAATPMATPDPDADQAGRPGVAALLTPCC